MKRNRLLALALALLFLAGCAAPAASNPGPPVGTLPGPAEPPAPEMRAGSTIARESAKAWSAHSEGSSDGSTENRYDRNGETEQYLAIVQNPERAVAEQSTVTLSLKVDTAAYSNVARYMEDGVLPPSEAVRTEELLNYFSYDAPVSFGDHPFAVYAELGVSPFDPGKYLAFLRVKTPEVDRAALPPCNLTFLIDTSGSMESYDKLPLLKEAFALLTETLDEDDRVSIVAYAGSAGVVLDGASGDDKQTILSALDRLSAGGSTAGGAGIELAYRVAKENRLPEGNNRVILATDGDFNVGINSIEALTDFIGTQRDSGIYLSVLGFGTGNLRDDVMETLSAHGDGNYAYINSIATAQKVLVEELGSNLFTVADDVKAQVEFNPANVEGWRLIGYENRMMANEDFADDTKDAGEIGAGTDVVALFELTLDPTRGGAYPDELFELRIRYKEPGGDESRLAVFPVEFGHFPAQNSSDFNFAASVAMLGELLRGSDYAGADMNTVLSLAEDSLGQDSGGYRAAHIELLRRSKSLF